ncbi:MAG TPA: SpoIID/LytB domain-containing protein [Anaerolineae bacterium]|nr:SpoIID/LytB domain-containing protein [Anaerolineae bacterium]
MPEKPLRIPETLRVQLPDGRIEEMPLDEYLKGVVPTEMGLKKPLEALKAQAIASRSFAVSTRRHARQGFDVCTTVHCQAWKPKNRYPDSDRAVEETKGQVVTYNGSIVGSHFFGHCDGHTRNSEDVWSNAVPYYRSVPCICGYTSLYGHGVGMCQRGAAAMARQGATVEEIIRHYYTGVQIGQAQHVPRTSFRRSVIFGQVVDEVGAPRGDLRLILRGPEGPIRRGTTADGRFWFTKLPAGRWELEVRGKPIRYAGLTTDGRNSLEMRVVAPYAALEPEQVVPLAHPPAIIGTLGIEGLPVRVITPQGEERTAVSGSAADFDPTSFQVPAEGPGTYTLHVLDREIKVQVQGAAGAWVRMKPVAT